MSLRLPLSAKILLWLFLNLAAVAAVFLLLFNAQFRFNLDWVFASSAGQRVEAVRGLIVDDLNASSPEDWDRVTERFSEAYGVKFALLDTNGAHLVGEMDEPPPEVRARFAPRGPQRAFVRTTHPTLYWLVLRTQVENLQMGKPMPVILLVEADSVNVGGLIFDLAPWGWLGVGAVAFSLLFWLPLLRGMTRSIAQMTHTTREIAEGHFEARVRTGRRDELGVLAETINRMAARLSGFVQGQKRFLGDTAHELCAPLSRLQMVMGILEQRTPDAQKNYVESANEKVQQIATLVNELLLFSRATFGDSALRLQPVNVREAAAQAVQREAFGDAEIQRDIPENLCVLADRDLLVQALANLIRNALRHGGGGAISLQAALEENGKVAIRVADSGPGVPEEELEKIFDAFYRVDTSRTRETGGTGLGLTIVKTGVDSCGGSVTARNRQPQGLEVTVRLPAA